MGPLAGDTTGRTGDSANKHQCSMARLESESNMGVRSEAGRLARGARRVASNTPKPRRVRRLTRNNAAHATASPHPFFGASSKLKALHLAPPRPFSFSGGDQRCTYTHRYIRTLDVLAPRRTRKLVVKSALIRCTVDRCRRRIGPELHRQPGTEQPPAGKFSCASSQESILTFLEARKHLPWSSIISDASSISLPQPFCRRNRFVGASLNLCAPAFNHTAVQVAETHLTDSRHLVRTRTGFRPFLCGSSSSTERSTDDTHQHVYICS